MLEIITSIRELNIAQLMTVYEESNRLQGASDDRELSRNLRVLRAEQDMYAYLKLFLSDPGSRYAVWVHDGRYVAALRLEEYRDGFLITGLETAPSARNRGYARELINAVLRYLLSVGAGKVYSHVDKRNSASIAVHTACGFERILDYAVYIDGSVLSSSCTFCCNLK